ncbi:tetratricopeptide repeat protein [uncultured Paludibaculum sp.]|uniref:tetratricopeptide repeat protein n=1 Tax=uncultured Paludibaculum sp. TaxID=1765020 RepID=UPI002AAAB097|nr:tetratricopeptide repeat protein [uncultured Paludibaculum sp.]
MRTGFVCLAAHWCLLAMGCPVEGQSEAPDKATVQRWEQAMHAAQELREGGAYEAAYRGFEEAGAISRTMPGPPILQARTYESLGSVASALGRPLEAEGHYLAAIRIWETLGEPATVALLQSKADLVSLYVETGQTGRADRLAKRLAADAEGKLGSDSTAEGRVLIAISAAAYLNQDMDRAESLCRKAVRIKDKNADMSPEERSQAHNQLGLILWKRDHRGAALQEARKATEVLEKQERTQSLEYAAALANLAMMMASEHHDPRALGLLDRAIGVVRSSVGTGHVFLAELLTNYAELLKNAKRGDESKAARREAQTIYQRTLVQQPGRYSVDVADLTRGAVRR